MARGDEYYIGSPDIKRSDDPFAYPMPAVGDVLRIIYTAGQTPYLSTAIAIKRCDLVVIGAIYCNSDEIGGITRHFEDTRELYRAVKPAEGIYDTSVTPKWVKRLFGLDCEPKWIVGFVVREL
jgi:hypothetical protein